ncbi:MAG: hypothetical protein ABIR80_13060, partial [Opitutaceae bacterium]
MGSEIISKQLPGAAWRRIVGARCVSDYCIMPRDIFFNSLTQMKPNTFFVLSMLVALAGGEMQAQNMASISITPGTGAV